MLAIILLLITSVLVSVVAYALWGKRNTPGAFYLLLILAACAEWCLASALEYGVSSMEAKIWASKLQYIGIHALPTLYLLFAIDLRQKGARFSKAIQAILWLFPAITILLAFTNELHGLIWTGFTVVGQGERLVYHYGTWFGLSVVYSYVLLVIGSILVVGAGLRILYLKWDQILILLVSIILPLIINILYVTKLFPVDGIDPTPFAFSLTGVLFAFVIYRYQLFDITPIARDKLVDTLRDPVIVLDQHARIFDINPAAQKLLVITKNEAIGKDATQILAHWPVLQQRFRIPARASTEVRIIQDIHNRWYDSQVTPLRDSQGRRNGWLIILHDITEQKNSQADATRLAAVIEQAQETIVITDLNGSILYTNPYFEQTTGYSQKEALGKNPRILKSGLQPREFYRDLWNTILSGKTWKGTFINKRKDGSQYHEAATIFPIKSTNGIITNFAAVKRDITGQVAAEESLADFSFKLTALHEVNLDLSLVDSIDEMCRLAVLAGRVKLGFDRLGLWFVDPQNPDYLHGSYGVDENGAVRDERDARIFMPADPAYDLLQNQKAWVYYQESRFLKNSKGEVIGEGSYAVASLWDGSKVLGFISTDNLLSKAPVTEHQRELLNLYAQMIGNLTTRKRAENAITASEYKYRIFARQQLLLNEITRAAIEQEDVHKMLQILADRMTELFKADACYLTLWDDLNRQVLPAAASGKLRDAYLTELSAPQPGEPTFTAAVMTTGQPLVVPDIHNTPFLSPRLAAQFPSISQLALPLIVNNQKIGAVLIAYNQQHEFSTGEISIGEQAARQIALAVFKTKLLQEARQRATEAETLRQAGAVVVSTLDQEETIERILNELKKVIPYDSASVLLPRDDQLEIVGAVGFPDLANVIGLRFAHTADTPNAVVFEKKEPYIIKDAQVVYEAFHHPPHNLTRGWMGVPLMVRDRLVGMIALDSHQVDTFTEEHTRLATAFADQVAIALDNARLFEETQRLAITDSLTEVYNRRHFMELAQNEFLRSRRYKKPLSLIMLDIDRFKNVNDTYGHLVGDATLQAVAQRCRKQLRQSDVIGRYGGEEFIILLPETEAVISEGYAQDSSLAIPAEIVAQRLRETFDNEKIHSELADFNITISLGVSGMDNTCKDIETLIDRADQAMYMAKNGGRNRVFVWNKSQ
jgi:diguanylate cyclase (GGDEF)-like protein/PAS domain S-box-containing protein